MANRTIAYITSEEIYNRAGEPLARQDVTVEIEDSLGTWSFGPEVHELDCPSAYPGECTCPYEE